MAKASSAKRAERKDYEIIETFTVLYAGWELDHVAWVARNKKGELVLLMTDHGGLWDFGNDVSRLHEHITEAQASIAGIKKAISTIRNQSQ